MLTPSLTAILQQEVINHRLPTDFLSTIESWYFPIAQELAKKHQEKKETILINVNGSQGSGKSTLTAFLSLILNHHLGINTIDISLDDFYLTKAQRLQLAKDVHPLLATRGVPGTHDLKLATSCLTNLLQKQACTLPLFDKAQDDRANSDLWKKIDDSVDIILFEGWCIDAPFQSENELEMPINELETKEDASGAWRKYVNEKLITYHQQFFNLSDYSVFLQIPNFEKVYEWRGLQEQKLALDSHDQAVMKKQDIRRFIQHYERITRSCLKILPVKADMVIKLNDEHKIVSLDF